MQETVKVGYILPEPLKRVLKRIEEHDFEAYVVGGAVRDILLSTGIPQVSGMEPSPSLKMDFLLKSRLSV